MILLNPFAIFDTAPRTYAGHPEQANNLIVERTATPTTIKGPGSVSFCTRTKTAQDQRPPRLKIKEPRAGQGERPQRLFARSTSLSTLR